MDRLPVICQKGFAPVALIIFLLFGIAAGTLLVQNGVNFIPRAANDQEGLRPVDKKKLEECDAKFEKEEDRIACKSEVCAADEVTYCDNRGSEPKAMRKTGGYFPTKDDPNYGFRDEQNGGCVFDFFEVVEKKDQCKKLNSKNGDVVFTTKDEGNQIDSKRKSNKQDSEKADKCVSKVECRKNGDKLEAWRIISTYDDENGKKENNFCIGAKIENGRLTADFTVAKFEFHDAGRDGECKNDKQVIEQSSNKSPDKKEDLASSSDRGRFGIDSDAQRTTLKKFFEEAKTKVAGLSTDQKKSLEPITAKINNADKALNEAKILVDKCVETGDEGTCGEALTLQIKAVAQSREALAEAIASGVEGIRVKTDLQIGTDNTNKYITAKPANGKPGYGRVFSQANNGNIYFVVRAEDGNLYEADLSGTPSLKQGMSLEEYQAWLKEPLEGLRAVTKTQPALTNAPLASQSLIPPLKNDIQSYRYEPQSKDNVFIARPVNPSFCPENCEYTSKACFQREFFYSNGTSKPAEEGGRYKCYNYAVNGIIPGNEAFYPAEFTIVSDSNKTCNSLCTSDQKCVVGFVSPRQNPGVANYVYTCLTEQQIKDLPQERINNNFGQSAPAPAPAGSAIYPKVGMGVINLEQPDNQKLYFKYKDQQILKQLSNRGAISVYVGESTAEGTTTEITLIHPADEGKNVTIFLKTPEKPTISSLPTLVKFLTDNAGNTLLKTSWESYNNQLDGGGLIRPQ